MENTDTLYIHVHQNKIVFKNRNENIWRMDQHLQQSESMV